MRFDDNRCGGEAKVLLPAETAEALPAAEVPIERFDRSERDGCEVAVLSDGPPCTPSEVVFEVAPACSVGTQAPRFAGDDGSWDAKEPFTDDDADKDDADDDDDDDFFPDDADEDDDDHVPDDDDQDDDFE